MNLGNVLNGIIHIYSTGITSLLVRYVEFGGLHVFGTGVFERLDEL